MSSRRPERVPRPLALGVGVVLAVAATVALVLTDELALLRLAVVAALWAFLIAAFFAGTRKSDPAASTELTLRRTHELELQHEVAVRREAELGAEVRIRREIESGLREDIAGLRGDIVRLRQDILERWDGELRVERVAVRAESTRVSGFGATFHALQDEARRLADSGRPLFEVEPGAGLPQVLLNAQDDLPAADVPAGRDGSGEPATATTVEFSVVPVSAGVAGEAPGEQVPDEERTGPLHGLPVPPGEPPSDFVAAAAAAAEEAVPGRRSRHGGGETAEVGAAELVARLYAETTGEIPVIRPDTEVPQRRRRSREDDEPNDVLARVLRGG